MKEIELVEEKLNNFKKWLAEVSPHDNHELADLMNTHMDVGPERFITEFIYPLIMPKRDKLDWVVDALMLKCKLLRSDFTHEHIEKFKRYLEFFCETCDN